MNDAIRIRVTDLETYRHWKDAEDATLDELLARLRHTDPPTPQMEAGRAFAKLLERVCYGQALDVEKQDGWEFHFDLDGELAWPGVRELKGEISIETPDGPVTLVGQCDAIGLAVHDAKLTERVDAERYLDSLQWRAYLEIFGRREFIYDLFHARYEGPGKVRVGEHHRMSFYAYPEMRADVERAVCELTEVVAKHVPSATPVSPETISQKENRI